MADHAKPERALQSSERARSAASWESDPKLRVITDMILDMPVGDRLRQIEANANFFSSVRPLDS